jgi:ABC-type uncharacterized transport system involved in gliding motility auxiliary subunit
MICVNASLLGHLTVMLPVLGMIFGMLIMIWKR